MMVEMDDYRYIDQLMDRYPQLDNDELKALARKVRAGDKTARELLILHNLRLVVSVAKPYTNPQTYADGVQEAIEGLIRAVDKYDPELGYSFSTYAIWWIKQAVRIWIFRKHKVYVPRYMHDAMIRVKQYSEDGVRSAEEIAERAGMDLDRVISAQEALSLYYVSMDAPVDGVDDSLTLADFLLDEDDPYREFDENDSLRQQIDQILAVLSPRDRQIVRMFFGFDGGEEMSLSAIAPHLGISRERVRQLFDRAMERMQASTMEEVGRMDKCLCGCGQDIAILTGTGGRVRQFAGNACRLRYQRQHKKEQEQSA